MTWLIEEGVARGETSLSVGELAFIKVGVTFLSIVTEPACGVLVELVESGLLLEVLFQERSIYSSFKFCCFSKFRAGNEAFLFESSTSMKKSYLLH